MRTSWPLVSALVGLAAGLGFSIPNARGDAKGPTIPVSEIHPGMKGYGLTVFRGTEPERFDVEVIDILHNFRPGQDLILFKTPNNARLELAKAVHGMSGSPIYFDGRLAGAYSYSLSNFPAEAIAGATPIALMLHEMRRPIPPGFWPIEGGAPLPSAPPPGVPESPHARGVTSFDGPPGSYDLEEHAASIAKRLESRAKGGWIPNATPLMVAGLGERTSQFVRDLVEPLGLDVQQGGGGGSQPNAPNAPAHFVDGGTLGVPLVTGDLSMMALGTATHVEGHLLCGWGHPFFEAGDSALPAGLARILWINASIASSSKLGELVRPLGAVVQDRQSAIVVDENRAAPTFPMSLEIRGATGAIQTSWHAQVAEERFMTPSLAAAVLGAAIEASASERRDVTWKLESKVTVHGHGTIALEDFGVAVGGMPDSGDFARARLVRAVGDVINNPWQLAGVERVESVLSVKYARDLWRLRGVDALDEVVDAGKSARVVLHLVPFVGPEITKTLDVPIPAELAGKDAEVDIVPGYEVAPELAAPESLDELLANETRQSVLPRSVVAQIKVPGIGVAFRGHVAPALPPFALDALRPAHSDVGPEPFPTYARTVFPVDQYVEGHDRVKIKVRPVVR